MGACASKPMTLGDGPLPLEQPPEAHDPKVDNSRAGEQEEAGQENTQGTPDDDKQSLGYLFKKEETPVSEELTNIEKVVEPEAAAPPEKVKAEVEEESEPKAATNEAVQVLQDEAEEQTGAVLSNPVVDDEAAVDVPVLSQPTSPNPRVEAEILSKAEAPEVEAAEVETVNSEAEAEVEAAKAEKVEADADATVEPVNSAAEAKDETAAKVETAEAATESVEPKNNPGTDEGKFESNEKVEEEEEEEEEEATVVVESDASGGHEAAAAEKEKQGDVFHAFFSVYNKMVNKA